MTATNTHKVDVLIIGAGPAGLMLASCLSSLNVTFEIIDKRHPGEIYGEPDGIQPRTTEIWKTLGLADELLRKGHQVHRLAIFTPNESRTGIELKADVPNVPLPDARYPFEVLIPVQSIEGIMRDNLASKGIVIRQPVIPVSLQVRDPKEVIDPFVVEVTLSSLRPTSNGFLSSKMNTNETIVKAKYVIGCDGARSWVRDMAGISMQGKETEFEWGVMNFTPVTNLPTLRAKTIVESPFAPFIGYLPRPHGKARLYALLGGKDGLLGKNFSISATDIITQVAKNAFLPYEMEYKDITWASIYKVKQKVASKYSAKERIYIAGDACHIHSPMGGQGANIGMADSYNLAWKLALVIQGHAKPSLLDSYEEERRPVSLELLSWDAEIFELIKSEGVNVEELAKVYARHLPFGAGLGIEYKSTLSIPGYEELAPGLKVGRRFPPGNVLRHCDWNPINLHDLLLFNGRFKLFIFPGDTKNPSTSQRFIDYTTSLETYQSQQAACLVDLSIILHGPRQASMSELGLSGVKSSQYESIYLDEPGPSSPSSGEIYQEFGISLEGGVAALIRPDGYICRLMPISESGLSLAQEYFTML